MNKQLISIALLVTILLQSCVAYQKTSVSLNEAANKGQVRVYNNMGERFVFAKINLRDSVYYGVKGSKETTLYAAQISGLYLHDIDASKRNSKNMEKWGAGVVIAAVLGALIIFIVLPIIALKDL